jgi:adenylate cyclase
MSHKDNIDTVFSFLQEPYTTVDTRVIPKRPDLTFSNTTKKIKHATVFYVDMRGSRDIIQNAGDTWSIKVHRAFLQSIIYCVENRDGHFRSFNGDGALAFFVGENAASRAVRAGLDLNAYVIKINEMLEAGDNKPINYGIGIAQGPILVAKSGKRGDDFTKQDLVWVGLALYAAVELSDFGTGPKHLWISENVRNTIGNQDHLGVVYNKNGDSMWREHEKILKSIGACKPRSTTYHSVIEFD